MDSIEHHIAEISEHLNNFIKEPKDVKGYTLINANILKDVKVTNEKTHNLHLGKALILGPLLDIWKLLVDTADDLLRVLCDCLIHRTWTKVSKRRWTASLGLTRNRVTWTYMTGLPSPSLC